MSEERLEEIKDNIASQLEMYAAKGTEDVTLLEAQELIEEVETLKEEINWYRSTLENIGTEQEIDWMDKYV